MSEKKYWLWLTRIKGIGLKKIQYLLTYHTSPKGLFYMERASLKPCFEHPLFRKGDQEAFFKSRDLKKLIGYERRLEALGIGYTTIEELDYPSSLLELYDPPKVLYYRGNFKRHALSIGVVGARKCTAYGRKVAESFGYDLARAGVNVVSGLASGIDGASHLGALKAGGFTTAVLGCGINVCYPKEHLRLMHEISEKGCLISEYGLDVQPKAGFFPMRNRIISGLSQGVLVVEAKKRSGSLITVDAALEGGKDIFSVPGDVLSSSNIGSNNLIKLGAKIVFRAEDILEEYTFIQSGGKKIESRKMAVLEEKEQQVYNLIGMVPLALDELIVMAKMEVAELKYILTKLEIKELIRQLPASQYIKNYE